jgi:diadenosine tetraphosphate (Ap4A) HIT family hydrolase
MPVEIICDPTVYYNSKMRESRTFKRNSRDHQWIFELIECKVSKSEQVYIDEPEWMLCRDLHPGTDARFLVVFKDKTLVTIRDLRAHHIHMLKDMQKKVHAFLNTQNLQNRNSFQIFFHYPPSVYQLHAHVSPVRGHCGQRLRTQYLNTICANLMKDTNWYRDALILTSYYKITAKSSNKFNNGVE